MNMKSIRLSDKLALVRLGLDVKNAGPVTVPNTHHVFVVDVSYSMVGELPLMRKAIKAKLPAMVREGDAVTVVWFSGRGECGALIEREELPTLRELKVLQDKVDRWIKPVGMTGFKEPLALARSIMEKDKRAASLLFLTDGMDNQWSRPEILAEVRAMKTLVASAAFVEYGYYANKKLLADMAAECGGQLVFAEDFVSFEPVLEARLKMRPIGVKLQTVTIPSAECDIVFAIGEIPEDGISTYKVEDGKVLVPEGVYELFYIYGGDGAKASKASQDLMGLHGRALYAALAVYAPQMRPDIIESVVHALDGDVRFIRMFQGLYGKQAYTRFQETAASAVWNEAERGKEGFNSKLIPNDNAVTILDVLGVLANDEQARILFEHPAFKYTKISRGREEVVADGETALKFTADPAPDGYPMSGLTYNENRANISVLLRKPGKVDLTDKLPFDGEVPRLFPTHVFRNYALVNDSLVNVARLPVKVSDATYETLRSMNVPMELVRTSQDATWCIIDMAAMPLVNRKRVASASAAELAKAAYELQVARCRQKVANAFADEHLEQTKLGPVFSSADGRAMMQYSPEAREWLKTKGITENGFQPPHTKQKEAKDFYIANLLKTDVEGMKTLPTVDKARDGKGGLTGRVMKSFIDVADARLEEAKKDTSKMKAFRKWVEGEQDSAVSDVRYRILDVAQKKLAVLAAGIWFPEFQKTPGEGKALVKSAFAESGAVEVSFKLEDKEVWV